MKNWVAEFTHALWATEIKLTVRERGALEDVIRVASDHGLHRRWFGKCLLCESLIRLQHAVEDATQ